jgi:hypothetical protein
MFDWPITKNNNHIMDTPKLRYFVAFHLQNSSKKSKIFVRGSGIRGAVVKCDYMMKLNRCQMTSFHIH